MKKLMANVIEKNEIEQATEYPFYATILPFKDKRFDSPINKEELVDTMTLIPGFAMNVTKELLN